MDTWTLDFNDILTLQTNNPNIRNSFFYKMSLKLYVQNVTDLGFIEFDSELTYRDFKTIIDECIQYCNESSIELTISKKITEYINSRELFIEKRYTLGNDIKNHENSIKEKFEEYANIVNNEMNPDRPLREQQMWDSFFMFSMKKAANFSVPGSGKTSSVLGIYAFLHAKKLINRIIVICPKNAFGSWIDEFQLCFKNKQVLNYFNIHNKKYKTVDERKRALKYDTGNCNLILINYESLKTFHNEIQMIIKNDSLLVYDEVHKVKRVNGEYAKYAVEIAQDSLSTIVMTGTPIPNGYIDIYNFLHILFPNEYNDFFGFETGLLKKPDEYDISFINNKIQPFFCRTTKQQLGVPDANPDEIISIENTNQENEVLRILNLKYRNNKLALLIRILQLESNPKLLLNKLNTKELSHLIDDDVEDLDDIEFADYSQQIENLLLNMDISTKYEACLSKIKEIVNQGKTVILWCIFSDTMRRFKKSLREMKISAECVYGEVDLENREKYINNFKSKRFNVLITNPHTLAESVSLHHVCHDAIYFEYSYNLVHLLQSKDRIHRLGLNNEQYTQYYFMQAYYILNGNKWSMDNEVYNRLKLKENIMLEAIANRKLEIMPTKEEDLEMIFSNLKL